MALRVEEIIENKDEKAKGNTIIENIRHVKP